MTIGKIRLPRSLWGRVWLAGGCVTALAAVAVTAGYLSTSHDQPASPAAPAAVDITRVSKIRQSFPAGYEFREGQRLVSQKTVDSIRAPKDRRIRPEACAAQAADSVDNTFVGTKMYGVDALGHGLMYVITAQETPPSTPPHQEQQLDCSYTEVAYSDGRALSTPTEAPTVPDVKIQAVHTVTQRAGAVIDSYSYKAWLDGHHAVVLSVASDPGATPPANPIDPTFAKKTFAEAITLVRGH